MKTLKECWSLLNCEAATGRAGSVCAVEVEAVGTGANLEVLADQLVEQQVLV